MKLVSKRNIMKNNDNFPLKMSILLFHKNTPWGSEYLNSLQFSLSPIEGGAFALSPVNVRTSWGRLEGVDLPHSAAGSICGLCSFNFSGYITTQRVDVSGRSIPMETNIINYNYCNFKTVYLKRSESVLEKEAQTSTSQRQSVS